MVGGEATVEEKWLEGKRLHIEEKMVGGEDTVEEKMAGACDCRRKWLQEKSL